MPTDDVDFDSNAELRSIMALLNPSAPVAILADSVLCTDMIHNGRRHYEEIQRDERGFYNLQMSSHDVLGYCIDIHGRRKQPKENAERRKVQEQLYIRYRRDLLAIALPENLNDEEQVNKIGNRVYTLMCRYVYNNVRTYFPQCSTIRFRFVPMEDMNQRMRMNLCHYLAGRQIMQEIDQNAKWEDHAWKSLPRLYCECAAVVVQYERPLMDMSGDPEPVGSEPETVTTNSSADAAKRENNNVPADNIETLMKELGLVSDLDAPTVTVTEE